jgi:hypothetical protein
MKRNQLLAVCALLVLMTATSLAGEAMPKLPPVPKTMLKQISEQMGLLTLMLAGPVLGAGFAGLMLLAAGTAPERVRRVESVLGRGRWAAVFIGILSIVALVVVAAIVTQALKAVNPGLAGFAALLLLGILLWLGAYGLAGAALGLGTRLLGEPGGKATLAGAAALGGTLCVPILGWLAFLYFLCRGVGAAALVMVANAAPPEAGGESLTDGDSGL